MRIERLASGPLPTTTSVEIRQTDTQSASMATNAGRRKRQRASDRRTTTPLSVASLSARSERVGHCAHDEFRRGISKDVLLKDRTQPQLACLLIKSMGAADRDRLPRPTQDVAPACRPWIVGQPLRLAPLGVRTQTMAIIVTVRVVMAARRRSSVPAT